MVVTGTYNPHLVALSILVAAFASYTALDLGGRVAATGGVAPRMWLVAGRDCNGWRNMVDALHRNARLQYADTDVLRHRSNHAFARCGDPRNRRRLPFHQSPERTAAFLRIQRRLHGAWNLRHALHRHGGNAGARRDQLRGRLQTSVPYWPAARERSHSHFLGVARISGETKRRRW